MHRRDGGELRAMEAVLKALANRRRLLLSTLSVSGARKASIAGLSYLADSSGKV